MLDLLELLQVWCCWVGAGWLAFMRVMVMRMRMMINDDVMRGWALGMGVGVCKPWILSYSPKCGGDWGLEVMGCAPFSVGLYGWLSGSQLECLADWPVIAGQL